MTDISEITLDQIIYRVTEIHQWASRKKITMVDADGIEWHRYDSPSITYKTETLRVIGKSITLIEGEMDSSDFVNAIYVENLKTGEKEGITAGVGHVFEVYTCIGDAEAERQSLTTQHEKRSQPY